MAKIKLREIMIDRFKILREGKNDDGESWISALVPWVRVDKKNSNGRIYSRPLISREIGRLESSIKKGSLIGTGDHSGGYGDIKSASHIVRKLWLDSENKGWAEIQILGTPRGQIVQTLLKAKATLGISLRGFGTVDEKTGIVNDDFQLKGLDIVIEPSEKSATFSQKDVFESLEISEPNEEEKKEQMKKLKRREHEMIETLRFLFERKKAEGYTESWEEFFEENENCAREIHGLEIIEKDGDRGLEETKHVVPLKKVTPGDVFLESRMLGISGREYAEKHNAEVERETLKEDERALRKMFVEAGCSPEEATKKVEEWRGKPKLKTLLSEEWKEAVAELMEKYNWDFDTALKSLKDAEKEEQNKQEKAVARRKEIREILKEY